MVEIARQLADALEGAFGFRKFFQPLFLQCFQPLFSQFMQCCSGREGFPGGGGSCRVAGGRFGRCLNVLLATHIMHCHLECRRKGFPAVVEIAGHLADALESAGPNAAVEIDAAMKREVTAQTLRFSVSRPASDGGKRKAGSSRRHHSTSMRGVAPSLALCTRSVLLLPSKPYAVPGILVCTPWSVCCRPQAVDPELDGLLYCIFIPAWPQKTWMLMLRIGL